MTSSQFNELLNSIAALSPEQMRRLRDELDGKLAALAPVDAGETAVTASESAYQEVQRRLFDAGLLSEIKPPIRDLAPYRDRQPVPIQGEPLSETVIRERR
jgi:hypothetical protein